MRQEGYIIMRRCLIVLLTVVVLGTLAWLIACGTGGGSSPSRSISSATVTTTLSDPATCSASVSGPYSNVWVTIADVQINASASAGDNDPNWIDLTPSLKNAPAQVDLLAAATNQCFLATLGSNIALEPGTYQQLRVILADNTAANVSLLGGANHCGSGGVNCVILAPPNLSTPQILQLSSESKTGLKIPSGQIAGGAFTLAAGQTKDLNISFDSCGSIVLQGNGLFRLKPVLHAGEAGGRAHQRKHRGWQGHRRARAKGLERRGSRDHADHARQHRRLQLLPGSRRHL
jgi:hypothetical protein